MIAPTPAVRGWAAPGAPCRGAGGDVIFRGDDGAAIRQLNRPAKRNALSQAMWEAIGARRPAPATLRRTLAGGAGIRAE